tara:strand:- start:192 stop:362 length:171 start_codon:yes stop_codon:yes gene_type:complete
VKDLQEGYSLLLQEYYQNYYHYQNLRLLLQHLHLHLHHHLLMLLLKNLIQLQKHRE